MHRMLSLTPIYVCRCERCSSVSVISYTYYRQLCKEVDGMQEREIVSAHDYYTRMCMGAEMAFRFRALNSEYANE